MSSVFARCNRIAPIIKKAAKGGLSEEDWEQIAVSPDFTDDEKVMIYAACYAASQYVEEYHRAMSRRNWRG